MKYKLYLILVFFIMGPQISLSANFIKPILERNQSYYPETILTLSVGNLTLGDNYGFLIGSNQLVIDRQWYNFTAIKSLMEFQIRHFDKSSRLDNNSVVMDRLVIELYSGANTLEDTIYFQIEDIEDQLLLNTYLSLLIASTEITVLIIIVALITKYFVLRK